MRDKFEEALQSSLSHLLARVFRGHARAYGRAFAELGVTATHAHILIRLWMDGPTRIGALQRELSLSSATFTGAVDRMEKLGLLKRERDPDDRRATLLTGAAWPARRRDALVETTIETEQRCFSELTAAERRELFRLLTKLSNALTD